MTLEEFREEKKFSYNDLAHFFGINGITPGTNVYRYCKSQRIPNVKMMEVIKTKTEGKVTPNDIYEAAWKKNI
jgi:hypothetical protein